MTNIKNILYIEDNVAFAKVFTKEAINYKIKIFHKTNLEDMIEILPDLKGTICAVVLDIKCLCNRDQEVDRVDFIGRALKHLDQYHKDLPRFIFSADESGIEGVRSFHSDEIIFKKTKEEQIKLLQAINNIDSETIKIRTYYQEVFNVFNKELLDKNIEQQIVKLLTNQNSSDITQIKSNLALIRRVIEGIFQTLNKKRIDVLPDHLFKDNGDVHFWDVHRHLRGYPSRDNNNIPSEKIHYSGPIEALSNMIYKVASDHGAHTSYTSPDYRPTRYTVVSCTNALLDLILWYGQLVSNR